MVLQHINMLIPLLTLALLTWKSPAQSSDSLERPKKMTLRQFDKRVQNAHRPLIVCFCADTGFLCKQQSLQLEQLLATHGKDLEAVWIDMITNPKISRYFGINAVPVLILYIEIFPVWLRIGYLPQEQILQYLQPYSITQ